MFVINKYFTLLFILAQWHFPIIEKDKKYRKLKSYRLNGDRGQTRSYNAGMPQSLGYFLTMHRNLGRMHNILQTLTCTLYQKQLLRY